MWSKAKFVNRKFLMEEVYQQHQLERSRDDVISWKECLSCFSNKNPVLFVQIIFHMGQQLDEKAKII